MITVSIDGEYGQRLQWIADTLKCPHRVVLVGRGEGYTGSKRSIVLHWRVSAGQAAKCSDAKLRQMMAEAVASVVCNNEILKMMKHPYRAYLIPRVISLTFRLAYARGGRREDFKETVIGPMVRRMTG